MQRAPSLVVYTAVFGGYDFVPVPRLFRSLHREVAFICFADESTHVPRGWTKVLVEPDQATPTLTSRKLKILGHPMLARYAYSLWIDGNVALDGDPRAFAEKVLAECPIAIPSHPSRTCVYDEIEVCVSAGKATQDEGDQQLRHLVGLDMPRNLGLTETNVIARRVGHEPLDALMRAWWLAVKRGPDRDQFHLEPLVWRMGCPLARVDRNELRGVVRFFPHRRRSYGSRRARVVARLLRLLADSYHTPVRPILERMISSMTGSPALRDPTASVRNSEDESVGRRPS